MQTTTMSGHSLANNPQSVTPHAFNAAVTDIGTSNDELGSDDRHDQVQPTEGNMATPDSPNSASASQTLVFVDHPLRFSPTISDPEGFSPYHYSSGSSQQDPSPCMRLAPNVHLDLPFHRHPLPPDQIDHNALPRRSPIALPFNRRLNRQLKAVLSVPSSLFASTPTSSTRSTGRQIPESLQVVPKLPPDQLGFSKFGFTPLPLTVTPVIQPRHARKLSDSRDTQALLTDVARLFGTMDVGDRAKFAAEIGQIVGLRQHGAELQEGRDDQSTRREDKDEESDH